MYNPWLKRHSSCGMSQFVTVQVGQCGNQIGSAFWPLALHEYGIEMQHSNVNLLKIYKGYFKNDQDIMDAFDSFFYVPDSKDTKCFKSISDLKASKVKARAVLIDMEDGVLSRFRRGSLQQLFDPSCTVTNYPGSGNNWAVGYYTHGQDYQHQIEESIRYSVEKCDCLHGFLLLHSMGGGTGSGLGTATLKLLNDFYPHVDKFVTCVYPCESQDVITAPYNVLLASKKLIEYGTCVFPVENRALQDICNAVINSKKYNIDQAQYNASCSAFQDMNSIIVNMLLHLTSGSRFPGYLNTDMNELATNLVAFPKMQHIFTSVSPAELTAYPTAMLGESKCIDEIFSNAWSKNNQLLKTDPLFPGSIVTSSAHIFRGDISVTSMQKNIDRFQKKAKFTTWSKESMKMGICCVPPPGHSASLLCMMNSSAMHLLFKDVIKQFDKLFKKRAHIHHYTQVNEFELTDFTESRETISEVFEEYKRIEKNNFTPISRLALK